MNKRICRSGLLLVVASTLSLAASGSAIAAPRARSLASVNGVDVTKLTAGGSFVLRATPGHWEDLRQDVRRAGATVTRMLPIIDGLAAEVPKTAAARLGRSPFLLTVAMNGAVHPMGLFAKQPDGNSTTSTTAPSTTVAATTTPPVPLGDIAPYQDNKGSMHYITNEVQATDMWAAGVTGAGVDIAVIDTGVAPVQGLAGKIINGPDISLDSPYTKVLGIDAFGHGTNIASIAAGLDPGTMDLTDPSKFVGVAPGARIINVKVGAFDGATDVSQVIAGIDWVVQHKKDNGMNIRVLNLSYGTESSQSAYDDPLAWAADVAWRNGIVVVAAAGNDGAAAKVTSPAYSPRIIAAGAVDQTLGVMGPASFTNAQGLRQPDMWSPGAHVLGLRVPNSFIDARFPSARVGNRLFVGSGTSQAAAVISGAAALLASAYPGSSPDQIRWALILSGQDIQGAIANFIQVAKASDLLKRWGPSQSSGIGVVLGSPGEGSIEATRGDFHLSWNGILLEGEKDIFGKTWDGKVSANAALAGTSWQGGTFNGATWAGASWAGASWAGGSWSGASWAGASWAGASWAGASWAGASWAGASWTGASWAGASWAGASWAGASWAGASWAGASWAGQDCLSFGWRGAVWG